MTRSRAGCTTGEHVCPALPNLGWMAQAGKLLLFAEEGRFLSRRPRNHLGKRYWSGSIRTAVRVTQLEARSTPQAPALEPREALRRAVKSLEDGPADPRTVEGAKVNALESIAWSLIGILGDRVQHHDHERPVPARSHPQAGGALTSELRNILGLEEPAP